MKGPPKPFGIPDEQGFYQVYLSNRLAIRMAHHLVELWSPSLECLALSGYILRDYPEDTPEDKYDWKYHILVGLDQNIPESTRQTFLESENVKNQFRQAYELAREGLHWNHGPLRMVPIDYSTQDEEDLFPGTLHHSLVFCAFPLWEKTEIKRPWGKYELSPFEYLQQHVFQFHAHPEREDGVYVSHVTGDEADRFILTRE